MVKGVIEEPGHTIVAPSMPGRPRIVFPLGRGNRGKTLLTRWMIERAFMSGRDVGIADADRTNSSLSSYFENVLSPQSADDSSVMEWFEDILDKHITDQKSLVIDFGGGDLTVKRASLELELVNMLDQEGIDLVAAHLIGPDPDDLAYLATVEENELFAPTRTLLIFNEYCIPKAMPRDEAFIRTVRNHKIIEKTLDRGARLVIMPALPVVHELDRRRIGFFEALAEKSDPGHTPLSRFTRQRVMLWLRDMESAFAEVNHWLP